MGPWGGFELRDPETADTNQHHSVLGLVPYILPLAFLLVANADVEYWARSVLGLTQYEYFYSLLLHSYGKIPDCISAIFF